MQKLDNKSEILKVLEENRAVLLYFSLENCSVCTVLKRKISDLLDEKFEKIVKVEINSSQNLELNTQFNLFTFPSILLFFDNKEFKRYGKNVSIALIETDIKRYYEMVF